MFTDASNSDQDTGTEGGSEGSEGSTQQREVSRETSDQAIAEKIADLGQFQRVKWKDKELPVNDLMSAYSRQGALSRQVQQYNEEKKYFSNLKADLSKVRANPALADEFRRVYPEQFHEWLEDVLDKAAAQGASPATAQASSAQTLLPKEVQDALKTVKELQSERHTERVAQREAEIDSAFARLTPKFPLATPNGDESRVLNAAQAALDRGEKLTPQVWEKIFKESNDFYQKAFESHYKTKFTKQNEANARGRDVARGGGIPGAAPKTARTLKEATAAALQDLNPN